MYKSLLICSAAGTLGTICGIGSGFVENFMVAILLIWLVLFFGGAILPATTGILIAAVDPKDRAFASGLSMFSFNIFGYALGSFLPGVVIQLMGLRNGMKLVFGWSIFGVVGVGMATFFAWKHQLVPEELSDKEMARAKAGGEEDEVKDGSSLSPSSRHNDSGGGGDGDSPTSSASTRSPNRHDSSSTKSPSREDSHKVMTTTVGSMSVVSSSLDLMRAVTISQSDDDDDFTSAAMRASNTLIMNHPNTLSSELSNTITKTTPTRSTSNVVEGRGPQRRSGAAGTSGDTGGNGIPVDEDAGERQLLVEMMQGLNEDDTNRQRDMGVNGLKTSKQRGYGVEALDEEI